MKSVGVDGGENSNDPPRAESDFVEEEEPGVEPVEKNELRDDVEYTTDKLGNTVEVLKTLSVDDKT